MRELPELTMETIKRMEDMTWFTHAQIFDDLLIVAQKETACYVWKTSEGLVVIDGIWPDERVLAEIEVAIQDAGWDHLPITKFLITHGHIDHVGCGKYLVENYGVKTFLSKKDNALRLETPSEEGRSDSWKEFGIDCFLADGDQIDCGDKIVTVIETPGHTDGCMSFLFPVYENGEKHVAALFGGATPAWGDALAKPIQRDSVDKFTKASRAAHADVALTNHTAFDNGQARIAYSRERLAYMPNIYVIGEEGVAKFLDVFRKIAE